MDNKINARFENIHEDLCLGVRLRYTTLVHHPMDVCQLLIGLHQENHLHHILHSPKPLTKNTNLMININIFEVIVQQPQFNYFQISIM